MLYWFLPSHLPLLIDTQYIVLLLRIWLDPYDNALAHSASMSIILGESHFDYLSSLCV